jgi:hypothetical protein
VCATGFPDCRISIYNCRARPHTRATAAALQFDAIEPGMNATMAELFSLTSLYILLGGLAVLGAVVWAARRATGQHGSANEARRAAEQGTTRSKGRLEGPCRRLRPCGHLYHADLWLERKRPGRRGRVADRDHRHDGVRPNRACSPFSPFDAIHAARRLCSKSV